MLTHRIVAYLVGLALGYWVLTHADKQKGTTQTIGKTVAWLIMGVSLVALLCIAACSMKCHADMGSCYSGHGSCPMGKDGAWMGGHGMMDKDGKMDGQEMMGKKDQK